MKETKQKVQELTKENEQLKKKNKTTELAYKKVKQSSQKM